MIWTLENSDFVKKKTISDKKSPKNTKRLTNRLIQFCICIKHRKLQKNIQTTTQTFDSRTDITFNQHNFNYLFNNFDIFYLKLY